MEEQDEYIAGETPVVFVGISELYGIIPGMEKVSNVKGLRAQDAIRDASATYYYNSYRAYFKYILNYPINLCDDETTQAVRESDEVKEMPAFPNRDSIKMINGIMVVKMG